MDSPIFWKPKKFEFATDHPKQNIIQAKNKQVLQTQPKTVVHERIDKILFDIYEDIEREESFSYLEAYEDNYRHRFEEFKFLMLKYLNYENADYFMFGK